MIIRLEDRKGNVLEMDDEGVYPPSRKGGYYSVHLCKYTYWEGKLTDKEPTEMHYKLLRGEIKFD